MRTPEPAALGQILGGIAAQISAQRAELRRLSAEATGGAVEHYRTGLAWADTALTAIAEAAGEVTQ